MRERFALRFGGFYDHSINAGRSFIKTSNIMDTGGIIKMNTIGFNQPQGNVADKFACRGYAVAASSAVALAFAAHTIAYKADAANADHAPTGTDRSQQTLLTPRFGYLRRG